MLKYQWTNGTTPTRSSRKRTDMNKSDPPDQAIRISSTDLTPSEMTPQISALETSMSFGNSDNSQRENTCIRIAQREMISQVGQNPFFSGANCYVDQVAIQDKFLKPICSIDTDKAKVNPM